MTKKITIISQSTEQSTHFEIIDRIDDKNIPTGTSVIIGIPLNLNLEKPNT